MSEGGGSSFDPRAIDELVHSPIRLGTMAILATSNDAEFTFLRDRLGATDGNLSTHLRRLEEAGYVQVRKQFVGRRPVTRYRLTRTGREAFRAYVETMDRLLRGAEAPDEDDPPNEGDR